MSCEPMKEFDLEERVRLAVDNFNSGYNCAQSVFLAYYDIFDLPFETAKSISVSFGGGMGRLREVCGTFSALCLLAGLKHPVKNPQDQQQRTENYAVVQRMAALFKEKYGTLHCSELLPAAAAARRNPSPDVRTPEYYASRPCGRYVEESARIAGRMLRGEI